EAFTAWGKEVGGLQAGLGYPPGQRRTYYTGETAKLVVRVRNVSKDAVKFQYFPLFLTQKAPTVADGGGQLVHFRYGVLDTAIFHVPVDVNLAPGKEIVLGEVELLTTLLGTGRFTVQYERVFGRTYQANVELDPALSKLATGKLELEIKAEPPPGASEFPVGWGGGGKDYELSVDKTVKHGGKASGSIKSTATTPLWYGALTQAFKAEKFRGQRLRMTAYVKSKDVENFAGLWMRIEGFDGKGNYSLSSDYMGNRPIKGSNDWKQYEVVLDVPKEGAAQIYFGV